MRVQLSVYCTQCVVSQNKEKTGATLKQYFFLNVLNLCQKRGG